jgi:peptidase inhibitor family I36
MRWALAMGAMAISVGTVLASSTAAQAAEPAGFGDGVTAVYDGQTINLKDGWAGAQSCISYSSTDVHCYATAAEADVVLGYTRAADPLVQRALVEGSSLAAVPDCASGWVCLWEAINGEGRRLIFQDDVWQDLGAYGFANVLSSWRNNQSSGDLAWIADDTLGTLSLAAGGYTANIGTLWNDTADSVQG